MMDVKSWDISFLVSMGIGTWRPGIRFLIPSLDWWAVKFSRNSRNSFFVIKKNFKCLETQYLHTHTHTRLTALFPRLPGWARTRKVKPIWILLKQETVSGISWAICKSAPCCRLTTTPAPYHSVFYRPDALPAAQPTASKHWRRNTRSCW